MSDLMTTAICNWLQATADDAMGMEPGDRHMANEAKKLLEAKDKEIERLTALLNDMTEKSTVVLGKSLEQNKEIERLTAKYDAEVAAGIDIRKSLTRTIGRHEAVNEQLRGLLLECTCSVEFDDERMSYVTVQIGRHSYNQALAALKDAHE